MYYVDLLTCLLLHLHVLCRSIDTSVITCIIDLLRLIYMYYVDLLTCLLLHLHVLCRSIDTCLLLHLHVLCRSIDMSVITSTCIM